MRLDASKSWVTAAGPADTYVWSSRPLADDGPMTLWAVPARSAGLTIGTDFDGLGLLSFGHAMFLGTAGYVCAHAAKEWGWPPEAAILAGTATSTLLGLAAGALAIRRQGIYFAMITLAMAQMIYFVWLQAPFTGGEDGLQGVPRGKLFGVLDLSNDMTMYAVVLAIFLSGFLFIRRIIHSPFGEVLKAIRENEPRAISLGYDVHKYKLLAFVLSAALAGMAGATLALSLHRAGLKPLLIDPVMFDAQLAPSFDGRSSAIAYAAFRQWRVLGAGATLEAHAQRIEQILVTDGKAPGAASGAPLPGFLRFEAAEIGLDGSDELCRDLGVDVTPRLTVLRVEEPGKRQAGAKVGSIQELELVIEEAAGVLKEVADAMVGDTITEDKRQTAQALPGLWAGPALAESST